MFSPPSFAIKKKKIRTVKNSLGIHERFMRKTFAEINTFEIPDISFGGSGSTGFPLDCLCLLYGIGIQSN